MSFGDKVDWIQDANGNLVPMVQGMQLGTLKLGGQTVGTPLEPVTPAWPASANTNAQGVNPNGGAFQSYPPGVTVIARDSVASWTLTNSTTSTILKAVNIPANTIGPDTEIEVRVQWSCSSSANNKSLQVIWANAAAQFNGNGSTLFTDVQTTNTSNELVFRISNRNGTNSQLVSPNPVPGHSTTFFSANSVDTTQDTSIAFWALCANAADAIRVETITVLAYTPQVYQSQRLNFGKPMFYGMNAHFDDGTTPAQFVTAMKTMGMKTLRLTIESLAALQFIQTVAAAFKADGTGLQIYCCIDIGLTSDGTHFWPSEAAAYAAGFASGQQAVQALAPYGVTMFECGNELDTKNGMNPTGNTGGYSFDFSNSQWPVFRGLIRGCIDGVHTVPGCLAASNAFTQCGIGASDMLWNGTAPDGSSGYTPVRWDITAWHNYEDYGPLFCIQRDNNGPWINLIEYISRKYQRPIVISEWNGKMSDSDPQRATWASRFLTEFNNNRFKYNIAGIIVYEMLGSPWNVMTNPTTVQSTFGTTVQSFISSNPDTGT